ncbi:MAG: TonB family protein [Bacillota bacterium]
MKQSIMLLCIGLVMGCSSVPFDETSITQPILLERYPLPAVTTPIYSTDYVLNMRIQIDENGNVNHVKLTNSIGDVTWDSLATLAIKRWKFTPAMSNGKPIKLWVNQKLIVKFADPIFLNLAEITCETFEEASKVMAELDNGRDFCELATLLSSSPTKVRKGVLGRVDIHCYSDEICMALQRIRINEHTEPLKYGRKYVIFMRMKDIDE